MPRPLSRWRESSGSASMGEWTDERGWRVRPLPLSRMKGGEETLFRAPLLRNQPAPSPLSAAPPSLQSGRCKTVQSPPLLRNPPRSPRRCVAEPQRLPAGASLRAHSRCAPEPAVGRGGAGLAPEPAVGGGGHRHGSGTCGRRGEGRLGSGTCSRRTRPSLLTVSSPA